MSPPRWISESSPGVLQARRRPLFVNDHGSPDVVGEASFQAPSCFARSFAFGEFGVVVGVTEAAGCSDLGDGNCVQSGVELAVAGQGAPRSCDEFADLLRIGFE